MFDFVDLVGDTRRIVEGQFGIDFHPARLKVFLVPDAGPHKPDVFVVHALPPLHTLNNIKPNDPIDPQSVEALIMHLEAFEVQVSSVLIRFRSAHNYVDGLTMVQVAGHDLHMMKWAIVHTGGKDRKMKAMQVTRAKLLTKITQMEAVQAGFGMHLENFGQVVTWKGHSIDLSWLPVAVLEEKAKAEYPETASQWLQEFAAYLYPDSHYFSKV